MKKFFSTVALVVALLGTAHAQDWGKGIAAYKAGDYAVAVQEWRPLAEQGDAGAQANLGYMYEEGQGVPQSYKEAVKWYRKAAEQGNAGGQANLGFMYDNGQGVLQDTLLIKKIKWKIEKKKESNT